MKIVYHSFYGRYSDSPRVIFEALAGRADLSQVWLAHPDHAEGFPGSVQTVAVDSADAVEALESADLLVANTHTETEWNKAPGATYLQTWHGVPAKRIHHDVLWAPPGRLARLDRDIARWDILVSPNPASTPRLRQAFRFDGEILESGYPRNDVLSSDSRHQTRCALRRHFGLDDDEVAVLYAPTWRDDEYFTEDDAAVPLALDAEGFVKSLGDGFRLLVRSHALMTGRSAPAALHGVIDASYYPDIADLYLAADVLVTDYSSAMFDFAITRKPIVFYTYDFERYRDSIRGFYFDVFPTAPGPVVRTQGELIDVLRDLPAVEQAYVDRYDEFRATHCPLDDGEATSRVLARLGL